jgi:hypothetical protein
MAPRKVGVPIQQETTQLYFLGAGGAATTESESEEILTDSTAQYKTFLAGVTDRLLRL